MAEKIQAGRWTVEHRDRATHENRVTSGDLTVDVNIHEIVKKLSARALKSKSGKATALNNAIVVTVSNRSSVSKGAE